MPPGKEQRAAAEFARELRQLGEAAGAEDDARQAAEIEGGDGRHAVASGQRPVYFSPMRASAIHGATCSRQCR